MFALTMYCNRQGKLLESMRKIFKTSLTEIMMVLILAGCASGTDDSNSAFYRQEFTDSELEEGCAEFEVAEHLSVDAHVTPMEKYKEGLNSYYQVYFTDTGDMSDADSFAENTTIFGHEQDEFFTMLEDLFGVSVNRESLNFDVGIYESILLAECQSCNLDMCISVGWNNMSNILGSSGYTPRLYVELDEELIDLCADAIHAWLKSGYEELDFGNSEELSEIYLSYFEELTGRKLSDTYDCITLSETMLSQLADTEFGIYHEDDLDFEDSYYFLFYYDIDGLPIDYMAISYELEGNETCTDLLTCTIPDGFNTVSTLPEWPLRIALSENGVRYLHFDNFRDKGEIYKESLDILTPTEILEKIVSYYDTKLLLDDMIITDMRLIYNSGFTDGEDGPIDCIFCPMWKVTVYDSEAEQNKVFLYDAETGEAYYEAYELSN